MKIFLRGLFAFLILVLAIFVLNLKADILPPGDYVEYWGTGRLNLTGGNPYNPAQLLALERSVGWEESEALIMYNPPWVLTLTMLMALLPFSLSRVCYFLAGLMIFGLCAEATWKLYAGSPRHHWVAWLVTFTLYGVLFVIKGAQITTLMVLAFPLFLTFEESRRDFLAGMTLTLLLIKPHIVYLYLLCVGIWILRTRRWQVALGLMTGLGLSTLIPVLINPKIFSQYISFIQDSPLQNWATATLSTPLRILFQGGLFWVQFLPGALGLLWLGVHWHRNKHTWDWITHTPLLLIISMVTSSYGWIFDHAAFVFALIQVSILATQAYPWRLQHWIVVILYVFFDTYLLLVSRPHHEYWWVSTAVLIFYLVALKVFSSVHEPDTSSHQSYVPKTT